MTENENIVIGDCSAINLYLHSTCEFMNDGPDAVSPLKSPATSSEGLHAFNTEHPLYGGMPVELLVPRLDFRRRSKEILCRTVSFDLPPQSSSFCLSPVSYVAMLRGPVCQSPVIACVKFALKKNRHPITGFGKGFG